MKRITAAIMAICIMLALAACKGGAPPEGPTPTEAAPTRAPAATPTAAPTAAPVGEIPYKIAVFTDMPEDEPETIAILRAEELYRDRIAWYLPFDDSGGALLDDDDEWESFVRVTLQSISDPTIKAMVFLTAGYMEVLNGFMRQIREARPDMLCITVDCGMTYTFTGTDKVYMHSTDVVLSIDKKATAAKAVNQAKRMGAKAIINFTVADRRYHWPGDPLDYLEDDKIVRMFPEIMSIIRRECENLNLEYAESLNNRSPANFPYIDGAIEAYEKYGYDICFLSNNCIYQNGLDDCAFGRGIIVQLCHPGIYHRPNYIRMPPFAGITSDEDHFGDLEWAIGKMESIVEEEGFTGRLATWRVPFSMVAATAAIEYAIGYCEGEIEGKADRAAMEGCFEKAMETYNEGDIGFELSADPEYSNHFMFTQDYIVF